MKQLAVAVLIILVIVTIHCAVKKVEVNCYPCQSPSGEWVNCCGGKIVWYSPEPTVSDFTADMVLDEARLSVEAPQGAMLTLHDGTIALDYVNPEDPASMTTGFLPAGVEYVRGFDSHVLAPTMSEQECDDWLTTVDPLARVDQVVVEYVAEWGPLSGTCSAFDAYAVNLNVQANAVDGPVLLETVFTSYGYQLGAPIDGPVQIAPAASFSGIPKMRRSQIAALVLDATTAAESGNLEQAISILENQLLPRVDGAILGDPSNDWVTEFSLQIQVIGATNQFISELENVAAMCQ